MPSGEPVGHCTGIAEVYFGEPVGRVKIQTTSKNSQRYHTTKRLMRDLLSNTPHFYVRAGEFRGYLFMGNTRQKYAKRNGIRLLCCVAVSVCFNK